MSTFFFAREMRIVGGVFCVASLVACSPSKRPPDTASVQHARVAPRTASTSAAPASSPAISVKADAPALRTLAKSDARPRPDASRDRSRALVVTEVQGLEALLASTKPEDPSRIAVLRRAAEDYSELEQSARASGLADLAKQANERAISAYTRVLDSNQSDLPRDRVTFLLANEYERRFDLTNARKYYSDVVAHSASPYAPYAWLAFGDMFFDEATRDSSKWKLAEDAYRKVIDSADNGRPYGYALYKLAWTLENEGDRTGAAKTFRLTVAHAEANAWDTDTRKIGALARADAALISEKASLMPDAVDSKKAATSAAK